MKKTITAVLSLFICLSIRAQQTAPAPAEKGAHYGAPVTAEGAIGINEVENKLENNQFKGKIKGKVSAVCMQKGCWMKIKNGQQELMVKFTGYAFFMPKNIVGKEVVVEGTADVKAVSVQQQKHYAEDAHKSKADIEKIKEPRKEMQFTADGVLVL